MAQDLNVKNPYYQTDAEKQKQYMDAAYAAGNSREANGLMPNFIQDFGNYYMGKNDYRAPETVFNPIGWYNPQPSQEIRDQQVGRGSPTGYYRGLMQGTAPSAADYQMRSGIGQANRVGMQSAAGARGIDRAAAFRTAQDNAAQLNAQGAIAGGQQRLQEQQIGAQGLSQNLQTTRQQDVGEQLGLAQAENQAQANLNKQYEVNAGVTGANSTREQQGMQNGVAAIGALLASDVRSKENIQPVGFLESVGAPTYAEAPPTMSVPQEQPKQGGGPGGMDISSITSMLSDERSKENLSGVHAYQFDYKDQDAHRMATEAANKAYVQAFTDAKRPREGVMAQDLAANPHAHDMVTEDQNGRLAIQGKRALGFIMANQASLNDRLNKLEGGRVS